MRNKIIILHNQRGSVMNVALLILMLLALIGFSASRTTTTDVKITGNYKNRIQLFYAAEAARSVLVTDDDLYDSDNITPDEPGVENGKDIPETDFGNGLKYKGYVHYIGDTTVVRGIGMDAEDFEAHEYELNAEGFDTRNTSRKVKVHAGFVRAGF